MVLEKMADLLSPPARAHVICLVGLSGWSGCLVHHPT
jgi:hypothetical protein